MIAPAPAKCFTCRINPVAWSAPRVDFCYDCIPGGPFPPPPCARCSSADFYTGGLCGTCHPHGPRHINSCTGCLAWGVLKLYRWRCWPCRWWNTHYPKGTCRICDRDTVISELQVCRLCWEHARHLTPHGRAPDLAVNEIGQQLFFANLGGQHQRPHTYLHQPTGTSTGRKRPMTRLSKIPAGQSFVAHDWEQLVLFRIIANPEEIRRRAALELDHDVLRYCDDIIRTHGEVHGWSRKQINDVRRSVRILHADLETPDAKINASDVLKMPAAHPGSNATATLDVLVVAGLLNDDRPRHPERYFTEHTASLPATITAQLRIWFDVMLNGSTTTPRRHPRDPETIKHHIRGMTPLLRIWVANGHDTLASITTEDVIAVLPTHPPRRHIAEQGLRSLFLILRARKQVFVDPMRRVPYTNTNNTIPLPLDVEAIRACLDSPDAGTALTTSLIAFHALTSRQVRDLKLTDIIDGRLTIDNRTFPLAGPVLPRLAAWLNHRNTVWPNTNNPHLLLTYKSAVRRHPVSIAHITSRVPVGPQLLRADRIIDEATATDGNIRIICELFGLSVATAMRYVAPIIPAQPRTHGPR
ncbi:MAG: hypothetical protein AAB131_14785 [Actinomycetota bacterium]